MEHLATIKRQLNSLNLSGISQTLYIRYLEAQNNKLSYNELLSLLFNAELEKKQARRFKSLI